MAGDLIACKRRNSSYSRGTSLWSSDVTAPRQAGSLPPAISSQQPGSLQRAEQASQASHYTANPKPGYLKPNRLFATDLAFLRQISTFWPILLLKSDFYPMNTGARSYLIYSSFGPKTNHKVFSYLQIMK